MMINNEYLMKISVDELDRAFTTLTSLHTGARSESEKQALKTALFCIESRLNHLKRKLQSTEQ